jgi:hypothetical protein
MATFGSDDLHQLVTTMRIRWCNFTENQFMQRFIAFLLALSILPLFQSCESSQASSPGIELETAPQGEFNKLWYDGQAEVTSYDLKQARYGEIHDGQAVMIFVTEPFSKSKQVKVDQQNGTDDETSVMKLNFTKKFNTGIYPYSMMTSVFTPIDAGRSDKTLKVTTTSQEWCGHTFTQLNMNGDKYDVMLRSYFESEGDQNIEVSNVLLEDGIWNLIRTSPADLPTGELEIVPGTQYQRLSHEAFEVRTANAVLSTEGELGVYTITYPHNKRTLAISFQQNFPHTIEGWEETYTSGWGAQAQSLTTTATKKVGLRTAYWSKNGVMDAHWREKLGL